MAASVDDDGGETEIGDLVEHRGQEVNSQQDENTSDYSSEGCAHSGF